MVIYGYCGLWLFMVMVIYGYLWFIFGYYEVNSWDISTVNSQPETKQLLYIYIYILASIMRGTGVSNRTHDDCWSIQQGGLIKQHLENLQSFLTFWRPRNFRLRVYAPKTMNMPQPAWMKGIWRGHLSSPPKPVFMILRPFPRCNGCFTTMISSSNTFKGTRIIFKGTRWSHESPTCGHRVTQFFVHTSSAPYLSFMTRLTSCIPWAPSLVKNTNVVCTKWFYMLHQRKRRVSKTRFMRPEDLLLLSAKKYDL